MAKYYTDDERFIARCLDLAKMGSGNVRSNPMVGSVIVYNGKIIGEGYHQQYGQAHAEVNAINSVKDKTILKDSTIYVNLEPCSHFGKTPPCADLIIKSGIKKVIIGTVDPFEKVAGNGIQKLKNAGCKVKVNVLPHECESLNKHFFHFHKNRRPYVILKWAQTADGFIDKIRKKDEPTGPNWITDANCRMLVHKWRTESEAIMVGTNTALMDNPALNVRNWTGNHPLRVVLDNSLRLPKSLTLFDQSIPTLVFTSKKAENKGNIEFVTIDFGSNVFKQVLATLYQRNITSLFVEGGSFLLNKIIKKNLWDEARVFTGDTMFGTGIGAPKIESSHVKSENIFNTTLKIYLNG